jgi:ferredoxin
MLKRTQDRKTTNLPTPNGKQSKIANTFALPAGKAYSCPGATSVCEKICYAGKLEKIYKGFRDNVLHNYETLKNAKYVDMVSLLDEMIISFKSDCDKWNADKLFRIHSDGDFFNVQYTIAWAAVIRKHSDVQFWVYTRSDFAVPILKGIPNLALYFSADDANFELATKLKQEQGVSLAYLAENFAMGKEKMLEIVSKSAVPCPENNKKLKLITEKGSACVTCGQCVYERNDILFSRSKK